MTTSTKARPLFDPPLVRQALLGALRKLDPRIQIRNPVMFVVFVGSLFTSLLFLQALFGRGEAPTWFILAISINRLRGNAIDCGCFDVASAGLSVVERLHEMWMVIVRDVGMLLLVAQGLFGADRAEGDRAA